MEASKRLEMLEGELKLLKGEVKETLSSVREYLQKAKLPTNNTVLIPAKDDEQQPIVLSGGGGGGSGGFRRGGGGMDDSAVTEIRVMEASAAQAGAPPMTQSAIRVSESPAAMSAGGGAAGVAPAAPATGGAFTSAPAGAGVAGMPSAAPAGSGAAGMTSATPPGSGAAGVSSARPGAGTAGVPPVAQPGVGTAGIPAAAPEEIQPVDLTSAQQAEIPEQLPQYQGFIDIPDDVTPAEDIAEEMSLEETGPSTPQVNLLANLIRWVASARRELGDEQLTTLLEVYGITGNLSPELKEVILQLVTITAAQPDGSAADVWSRLILELHGVLAGGGAPLHPVKALGIDDAIENGLPESEPEKEKPKYQPLKLKILYPGADGAEKEFTVDISPELAEEKTDESPAPAENQGVKKQHGRRNS